MKYYSGSKRAAGGVLSSSKMAKTGNTTINIYRGNKTEMKFFDTDIVHASTTGSSTTINFVPNTTAVQGRVGNKIKIWRVEMMLASSNSTPILVRLVLPKDPTAFVLPTFTTFIDPGTATVLKTQYLHNGAQPNTSGYHCNHKLPLGLVSEYNDIAGTDLTKNNLLAVFNQPIGGTINGTTRIWFTDA